MLKEQILALVRLLAGGFNAGDLGLLDQALAPDVVFHSPFGTRSGREDFKALLGAIRTGLPDAEMELLGLTVGGVGDSNIAWRWRIRGTHGGSFLGVAPTGRAVTMEGVDLEQFAQGLIVERWSFWDRLSVFEQLGMAPTTQRG